MSVVSFASPAMAATPLVRAFPIRILSLHLLVAESFREAVGAGQPPQLGGAAASNRRLTNQTIFSTAFVSACELPNWIQAPRQINGCGSRTSAIALSRPIPAADATVNFDPDLPPHRAWLLAVLEQLVIHEPQALEESGTLARLRTDDQVVADGLPAPVADHSAVIGLMLR